MIGEAQIQSMNLIFGQLLHGLEVKLSTYNKEIFQKNFKNFLKNIGHLNEGNLNLIKANDNNL